MTDSTAAPTAPTTADMTAWWGGRHAAEWAEVLDTYWAGQNQPHRHVLLSQLHLFPHFTTLLEMGIGAGTNLALIRRSFPWVIASGLDVNADAVQYAAARLANGSRGWFRCADLVEDCQTWTPNMVDVIISCYSCAYLDPASLAHVLVAAARAARIGLVFVEPTASAPVSRYLLGPRPTEIGDWAHPYGAALGQACQDARRTAKVTTLRFSPAVIHCDGVTTCLFTA